MDKHTVSFYPTSVKDILSRKGLISSLRHVGVVTSSQRRGICCLGDTVVPSQRMPRHIRRDGIHLFKMLGIQVFLGKRASDSKLKQQGDPALVCCITMSVQSSASLPPTLHHLTHPTPTHSPTYICSLIPWASPSCCLPLLLAKATFQTARFVPPLSICMFFFHVNLG